MRDMFLVFTVANHLCALPVSRVQEILHLAATSQLPGQPPVLHGFLNLRGHGIPVVSLRGLFGEERAEPDLYAPIIVVSASEGLALLADDVNDVAHVDPASLEAIGTNHSLNDCAEARFSSPAGSVSVLSPERLLLAKERECVAALQAQFAKRLAEMEGAIG